MFIPNLLSADSGGETTLRARIVVVEDEPDLRDAVAEYLVANGFDVTSVGDAASMRALAEHETFQLAILDIAMPGEDGLSLGRWLRSQMPIGIIFATAAGTSIDRVVGLEIGADDYLVKPYELRELLARVRSVLRRVPGAVAKPGPRRRRPKPTRRAGASFSASTWPTSTAAWSPARPACSTWPKASSTCSKSSSSAPTGC